MLLKKPENMSIEELEAERAKCQSKIELARIRFMELGKHLEKEREVQRLQKEKLEIEAQMEVLEPQKRELEAEQGGFLAWLKGLFGNE